MARVLRGDIYWAELNPAVGHEQGGLRPVVILSHDVFNDRSGIVIAVAITSQEPRAGFPLTLEITTAKLPKRSWARIGQIRTLSVDRLGKRLSRIAPEELEKIVEGLNEIIGN
jgi:mRNA interferase MazF